MKTKWCATCDIKKPVEEFYFYHRRKGTRHAHCKSCVQADRRAKRYGLEPGEYELRLEEQDGLCAICSQPPTGKGPANQALHVDHDHCTGRIRGLLCGRCNLVLGQVGDRIDLLLAMVSYLQMG
jgi:hypothetical protein